MFRNLSLPGAGILALKALGVFIVGLIAYHSVFFTINERERGIYLRNGALHSVAQPGLGVKIPWIDSVSTINLESHAITLDKMEAYSHDQQPAHLRISVRYSVAPSSVTELYTRFGSLEGAAERGISPAVFQQTKIVFGKYTALRAIQDRGRLNSEVFEAISETVPSMIRVESVQVEDIRFSDGYVNSINERMTAEIEVSKIRQNAEREKVTAEITVTKAKALADSERQAAMARAEITVTQARAEAESQRLAAIANAERLRITGEAQASAIKARAEALRNNPDLVRLTQAERWDGKLPATMLPGNAVPMLNLQ